MKGAVIPFGTKTARATGTGSNAAVVVTLATTGLESGGQHVIDWINVGADVASATPAFLTVTAGGVTKWRTVVRFPSAIYSNCHFNLPPGLELGVGAEVVITLGAISGITGEVNVGYR